MLDPVTQVTGTAVPIPGADIDTDRIIPARFMKCVTFDGLGDYAFYDVRHDSESGNKTQHPLNDPVYENSSILIAGINFGCGSSREHAPQSLSKYGFKAIIAESFAEIFFGNSTTIGLPCVTTSKTHLEQLSNLVTTSPNTSLTIDLKSLTVSAGDLTIPIQMPDAPRQALLTGRHDPIRELLDNEERIQSTAASLHYIS